MRTIIFEVDYECGPLSDDAIVANQAEITVPADPALCAPCLSDNPITGPDQPTRFITDCVVAAPTPS